MGNSDTAAARAFHDATKLSYINLLTKPPLYKTYPGLPQVALPEPALPEAPALDAIAGAVPSSVAALDLSNVAAKDSFFANYLETTQTGSLSDSSASRRLASEPCELCD